MSINSKIFKNVLDHNLLLIHGNLASNNWWLPACEIWQQQANSSKKSGDIYMADWRGCGGTPFSQDQEFSLEVVAQDYIYFLKDNQVEKINVVGHSTGGAIALVAMSKAPELFNKAMFLDSVGLKGIQFPPEMDEAFKAMEASKDLTAQVIGGTIHENDFENHFFKTVIVEDAHRAVKNLGLRVLNALKGIDLTDKAKTLNHPSLVLHGEKDEVLPINDSKEMAAVLPHGEFRELKNQGHCTNYENPELFVELANNFF